MSLSFCVLEIDPKEITLNDDLDCVCSGGGCDADAGHSLSSNANLLLATRSKRTRVCDGGQTVTSTFDPCGFTDYKGGFKYRHFSPLYKTITTERVTEMNGDNMRLEAILWAIFEEGVHVMFTALDRSTCGGFHSG